MEAINVSERVNYAQRTCE